MYHEVILSLQKGALHMAPLDRPQRVLDVGTGTGIWAIDMADKYPMAEVIGTDLSPIQPSWVPPNCRFEVDDAEKDWTYKSDLFDFIQLRNIGQCIGDWPKLMSQIYRCTKPGAYVELAELGCKARCDDGTMGENNGIERFTTKCSEAMTKIGRPPSLGSDMKTFLEDAGFVDIKVHEFKQPFGPWPKDKRLKHIGAMVMLNSESAFHAYGMAAFTRILDMSTEEADKICTEAFKAVKNKNNHVYNYYYVVYGRKPE